MSASWSVPARGTYTEARLCRELAERGLVTEEGGEMANRDRTLRDRGSDETSLVEVMGIEPTTSSMRPKRSSQLSYTPREWPG